MSYILFFSLLSAFMWMVKNVKKSFLFFIIAVVAMFINKAYIEKIYGMEAPFAVLIAAGIMVLGGELAYRVFLRIKFGKKSK